MSFRFWASLAFLLAAAFAVLVLGAESALWARLWAVVVIAGAAIATWHAWTDRRE